MSGTFSGRYRCETWSIAFRGVFKTYRSVPRDFWSLVKAFQGFSGAFQIDHTYLKRFSMGLQGFQRRFEAFQVRVVAGGFTLKAKEFQEHVNGDMEVSGDFQWISRVLLRGL